MGPDHAHRRSLGIHTEIDFTNRKVNKRRPDLDGLPGSTSTKGSTCATPISSPAASAGSAVTTTARARAETRTWPTR